MFCPLCASKLELVARPEPAEINWDLIGDELDKAIKLSRDFYSVEREEYRCSGGCFREDYPLYFHHPFRGIDSQPGDSWSLSWVE